MSLRQRRHRAQIDEEIRNHLEETVGLLIAEGWDPEAARREATRRFGDVDRVRRELEDVHRWEMRLSGVGAWLRSLGCDVRYAARGVRGNPSFSFSVVATLALGLGAATTIFAMVDALLLRPVAYRDAERWIEVNQAFSTDQGGGYTPGIAVDRVADWRAAAGGMVDGWLAFHAWDTLVRTDGAAGAESLDVLAVTPGAERLLGVPLLLGRGFTDEDVRPGVAPVAVLGRAYWERTGASPAVLGRTIRTEAGPVTVVGVLRGGVRFPTYGPDPDLWLPLRADFTWADRRLRWVDGLWGRLRTGVTAERAQERADAEAAALDEQKPADRTWTVRLRPVGSYRAGSVVKRAVWTLAATVGAIFLIALVNGVSLALVRASARTREVAVRVAIGGSRLRLLRHFVVEGGLLGGLGGLCAALVAYTVLPLAGRILPVEVLELSPHAFTVEARTLTFVAVMSLAAGILLGLLPAFGAPGRKAPSSALAGRMAGDRPTLRRLRRGLVVGQVALTMVLLVVAALLTRSMTRLLSVDPGYDYEHIAWAGVMPSATRYPDAASRAELARRLEEALEARPEVDATTVVSGSGFATWTLQAEGEEPPAHQPRQVPIAAVSEDYFRTVGTPVVAGRPLTAADAGTDNVVVDEDLARFLWHGASPVGRRFRADDSDWMTVVGVVRELRLMGRDQRNGPYQFLRARTPERASLYFEVAMRTSGRPERLLPIFRDALRDIDPEQWVHKLDTGAGILAAEEETPRFLLTIMALLGGIATVLSAVGLYGVLAYTVRRRQRELGVRVALGAGGLRLRGGVLGEGIGLTAWGLLLGAAGALSVSGLVGRLLYDIEPLDPLSYLGTALVLLVTAAVAAWLPARCATRVDPVVVLRAD